MAKSTIKKDSGFGVAQLILLISIAILVIFVAWPVLLILFNAFFVEGKFNSLDFYNVLTEPETFQALKNSFVIACMTTVGSVIVGSTRHTCCHNLIIYQIRVRTQYIPKVLQLIQRRHIPPGNTIFIFIHAPLHRRELL